MWEVFEGEGLSVSVCGCVYEFCEGGVCVGRCVSVCVYKVCDGEGGWVGMCGCVHEVCEVGGVLVGVCGSI